MKKRKKNLLIFFVLINLFCLFLGGKPVKTEENRSWPNCPAIQAEAALVMDLNTGTVLVETNGTKKAYPASITKIMTALIALENIKDLDEMVFFPRMAIEMREKESSSIGMRPGEELSMRDCLYALMLASANEVANAIAIHVGGSIEEFVDLMNEKAEELGCVNTHFNNPNGLHDPEHYTCALDMAKIGKEALKFDEFRKIAGSRTYVIPETNIMKEKRPIANYHQMINPAKNPQYAYEYCYAGKTGYTAEAGMTLVSFAKKGSMDLACVVLKAETKDAQFGGTAKFFDYCFKRFRMEQAEKVKLEYEKSEFFTLLREKKLGAKLYTPSASMIVVPKRCDINTIETKLSFSDINQIAEGENEVGMVTYHYSGKEIGNYPLLFFSDKSFKLRDEIQEKQDKEELSISEEQKTEKEKIIFFYKLSVIIGGSIAFLSFLAIIIYVRSKRRKRRSYIHKSLRKKSKKRNRLW